MKHREDIMTLQHSMAKAATDQGLLESLRIVLVCTWILAIAVFAMFSLFSGEIPTVGVLYNSVGSAVVLIALRLISVRVRKLEEKYNQDKELINFLTSD